MRGRSLAHSQIDTVGRRAVDGEGAAADLFRPQRLAQGQGQRGGALFPVGGDDDDFGEAPQVPREGADAFGKIAVVVRQEDQGFQRRLRNGS